MNVSSKLSVYFSLSVVNTATSEADTEAVYQYQKKEEMWQPISYR